MNSNKEQLNQRTSSQTDVEQLQQVINRASAVINSLKDNEGWGIVLEDMTTLAKQLDDNWQNIKTDEHFTEARIAKMAVIKIIRLVADYEHDKMFALSQIENLMNKTDRIAGDYDGETKEE